MAQADPSESQRRTGVLVAAGLLLLVFGFTAALALPAYVDHSNPFWFVGMLVIFGAALALIAVVFRWLGIAAPDEAFALPSGSIRTLLAVGVMVLFTVFGLAAVSSNDSGFMPRVSPQPIGTAVAPAASAALTAEIQRYERQGIVAVVEQADAASATLKLHSVERVKPAETSDMQKQLITALVTLLTSVVSFYFGSRSAEVARDANAKATAADPAPTPDATKLAASIDGAAKRLAALQSDTASPGNEAALATALAALATDLPGLQADQAKIAAALADPKTASQAADLLAALNPRVDSYIQRLSAAEALVAKG